MTDFIRVSAIKDKLTECPICMHEFNEKDHLPRHMPCCVQSICHPCLQHIIRNQTLLCPLCRHEHTLPGGVASLPTEPLMLKILDHLKIQKGLRLPCTDCPDGNEAIARCDDCCVFLCEECHRAHARHRYYRDHKTVTFDEMKGRPVESFRKLHQCKEHQQAQQFYCRTCEQVICVSCTVVDHDKAKNHDVISVDEAHQEMSTSTNDVLSKLEYKVKTLDQTAKDLRKKKKNILTSREKAADDINRTFDNLIELLQIRRASLLSDTENKSENTLKETDQALDSTTTLLTKVKSSTEYTRQMREKADKVEDLLLMVSSTDALNIILQEVSQEVKFNRTGVSFVPAQVTQLKAIIDVLGAVRTVTFTPREKPSYIPADYFYNSVIMIPDELPAASNFDVKFFEGEKEFSCPHLELDHNTASRNVQISSGLVNNTKSDNRPQETGCRIQSCRRVLSAQPIPCKRGQVVVFGVRVVFTVKQLTEESMMIWETALTPTPVDANRSQSTGLSVGIVACATNKQQLCLQVRYDGKLHYDVPLAKNEIGVSRDLQLCIMSDKDANKIHVVDMRLVKVITSASDVMFDKPLWFLMYVGVPSNSDMRSELISGDKIDVTQKLKQLLSSIH